jgi:chemotaxis family two-component system sensor kinase Cph1
MATDRNMSWLLMRVCHDLRAPARNIRTHVDLLMRDARTSPIADLDQRLGFVAAGAQTLDRLIDRLASYSVALETGSAAFQQISAGILLRSALARLEPLLQENAVEVTHGDLPVVQGDPDRLAQVFEELIRNAASYRGHAAPRIHISAAREGGHWLFRVSDSGPGVESGDLERIFLPLERLHGGGPGMGLAICRAIIEAHRGRIWAEPASGNGLEVRFTLPD